jgi:hypothetical protein
MSHSGVVRAKNDDALGDFETPIHGARYVARIHVAGVRGDAPDGRNARNLADRGEILDFPPEFVRPAGVESARNGRPSYCGSHELPPDFSSQFAFLSSQKERRAAELRT